MNKERRLEFLNFVNKVDLLFYVDLTHKQPKDHRLPIESYLLGNPLTYKFV